MRALFLRRAVLVAGAAGLLLGAGVGVAYADGATSSSGVIDQTICMVVPGTSIQDCASQHQEYSTIVNPSGNMIFEVHGFFTETLTDTSTGQVIATSSGRTGINEVVSVDGLLKALTNQTEFSYLLDGQTCNFVQVFTFANNVLRFDHIDSGCS